MLIRKRKNGGFTLVELSISLTIMALALATLLPIFNQVTVAKKKKDTLQKMERVINSAGAYMAVYNDLPCPGKPDAAVFGEPALDCIANPASGVVPFRALGLQESEVIDGWGNYLTYRISPVFKVDPHDPAAPSGLRVHSRCRTDDTNAATPNWITVSGGVGTNVNPHKARLCCQTGGSANEDIGADIQILTDYDGDGTFSDWMSRPRDSFGATPGNFSTVNTGNPGNSGDFTAVAIVLVSHGPNGHGAMLKGETVADRYIRTSDFGDAEDENADADNVFQIVPESRAQGVNYYDDIVMFRTNDTLYAETTGRSCGVP